MSNQTPEDQNEQGWKDLRADGGLPEAHGLPRSSSFTEITYGDGSLPRLYIADEVDAALSAEREAAATREQALQAKVDHWIAQRMHADGREASLVQQVQAKDEEIARLKLELGSTPTSVPPYETLESVARDAFDAGRFSYVELPVNTPAEIVDKLFRAHCEANRLEFIATQREAAAREEGLREGFMAAAEVLDPYKVSRHLFVPTATNPWRGRCLFSSEHPIHANMDELFAVYLASHSQEGETAK